MNSILGAKREGIAWVAVPCLLVMMMGMIAPVGAVPVPGRLVAWGDNTDGQCTVPGGNDFTAVAAGAAHSLALRSNGSLIAWGLNDWYQCDVPAEDDFIAIAAGGAHSLALRSNGSLVAWGLNDDGQCDVPAGEDFTTVAAGGAYSLALRSNGSLAAWGSNSNGQCDVPAEDDFIAIAAGGAHGLALRSNNSLAAWGNNGSGQCNAPPGDVYGAIAAGYYHSFALLSNYSLITWGLNDDGQCSFPPGNGYRVIVGGYYHSLALLSNNSLVAWGNTTYGQCSVPAGNNFTAIAAGAYHNLAVQTPHPPLVAAFTAVPVSGTVPLTVHFTDDSTGSPTAWLWNLGDGTFSMNQDPVYVYTVCGRYTVSLSVFRAGESNTTVKPDYINVTAAPPGVTSLSPKRHRHNGRLFSATITGSGFQPQTAGAGVILWRTTPTKNITATDVNATSQSTLACSLRIPKKARTGLYRVTVINPDGQQDTLAKGFKILT